MAVARCVVAGDINLPQNHYNTFNILCTLLTVTYTSPTHTEHIVAFPLKKSGYANAPQRDIIRTFPTSFSMV